MTFTDTFNVSSQPGQFDLAPVQYEHFSEANIARAVAVIDGTSYNIDAYTFNENCHGATDNASVTLTASNNPDWTLSLFRDLTDSTVNPTILVNIYAGFPYAAEVTTAPDISQLELQFAGSIDQYTIKMLADEVYFECRSLGAPLTSNKITLPYVSGLTTDFIAAQAAKFGLQTNIPVASTLTMQDIMRDEYIAGIHSIVIWDLMLRCAVWDDMDIWVDSTGTLNYVQSYNIKGRPALDLKWGRDLIDCEIIHSPQFSKNIQVEVRSHTLKQKTSVTTRTTLNADGTVSVQQYQKTGFTQPIFGTTETLTNTYNLTQGSVTSTLSSGSGGSSNSGQTGFETESKKERYVFVLPGKDMATCALMANKLWRQISSHEYSVTLTLPATKAKLANMGITSIIRLHGLPYSKVNTQSLPSLNPQVDEDNDADDEPGYVGPGDEDTDDSNQTSYADNQGYWPRSIEHTFDVRRGWVWKIIAVNHTPPMGAV